MITIKKGNPEDKGIWFKPVNSYSEKHQAIITCPVCDGTISLERHTIYPDGKVFPSVVCVHDECPFHKYLELKGWS